ncbi:MAG: radical SAM family heme chaperone HemW, partial [Candidatus Omnitrophota bacterium]
MDISLYIHIPFCKSKCAYCSFASFANQDELIPAYVKALDLEARMYQGTEIRTVYIGGGTPTHLPMEEIQKILALVRSRFILTEDVELTMEANPATFDLKKAVGLQQLGVNRMSLGLQSLDDNKLKYLGRPHTARQGRSSFDVLRKAGIQKINTDLIYSLTGQCPEEIERDVAGLAALAAEHISLYSFTIGEDSEFYRRKIAAPPPEKQAAHYEQVATLLKDSGFEHYEVSNFARSGFACRHNLNYWQGGDYIGLGVAAHSHRDGHRSWNVCDIAAYLEMVGDKGSAKIGEERLGAPERLL